MDFSSMLRGTLPSLGANLTAAMGQNYSKRSLPDGMAHLLPLLGTRVNPLVQTFVIIHDMLGSRLGLDPTILLTLAGFIWAFNKVWRQVHCTYLF